MEFPFDFVCIFMRFIILYYKRSHFEGLNPDPPKYVHAYIYSFFDVLEPIRVRLLIIKNRFTHVQQHE